MTAPLAPLATKPLSWPARIGWMFLALLCLGIAAYSARYLLHPPRTPGEALGNPLGVPWLFIHIAGSVTAPQLPIFGDEFVTLAATDATTITNWKQDSKPPATETLMVVESDVSAETTRLLNLWKTPHTIFGFDCFSEAFAYEIGQTKTLTHSRFGLSAGVPALIVGVQHDWVKQRVRLEVLV